MRPALLLFALLMPLALLVGCRQQGEWYQLEGVALGTGYHITLNGDLGDGDAALVEAAIQGELVSLDRQWRAIEGLLAASRLPFSGAPPPPVIRKALRQHRQALAVDRLFRVFDAFGIANAMVELGGVVRTRGQARGRPWRFSLDRARFAGIPEPTLRLQDDALVTREWPGDAANLAEGGERLVAVSVVAPTAEESDRRARTLLQAGASDRAKEQAVRLVVWRPEGIDIHYGSALEPLLER